MRSLKRASWQFKVLLFFLLLVFFTGGGARSDIQSLIILRPASAVVCGLALWSLSGDAARRNRWPLAFFGVLIGLVLVELIPLPPAIWHALPGRDIVADIDRATGAGNLWRPISMSPAATWNALFSLSTPLAALLLTVQLPSPERRALLPILIVAGIASGVLGLLQVMGPADGPLRLYEVTNDNAAVGLFANRNHAAVFLATVFPMLGAFVATSSDGRVKNRRFLLFVCGSLALVPMVLVAGSRAGLLIAIVGVAIAASLIGWRALRDIARRNVIGRIGAIALPLLVVLFVLFARAEALQRIMSGGQGEDDRFQMWGPIARMGWTYFPLGSGFGTFVKVYEIDEPTGLLTDAYVNHAHNDWLELFMTGGLIALLLLVVAMIVASIKGWRAWRAPREGDRDAVLAALGAAMLAMFAIASIGDYPLRVPSLMCVFVIAGCWLAAGGKSDRRRGVGS